MSWPGSLALFILHALYFLGSHLSSLSPFRSPTPPQPLVATRRRIPRHLAIVLVSSDTETAQLDETALIESVRRAAEWCQIVGIRSLSMYDRHGILLRCSERVKAIVGPSIEQLFEKPDYTSDTDLEFPLTPPLSESSDSRLGSPGYEGKTPSPVFTIHLSNNVVENAKRKTKENQPAVRRRYSQGRPTCEDPSYFLRRSKMDRTGVEHTNRGALTLSILSYNASKPFMASAARSLAMSHRISQKLRHQDNLEDFTLDIESFDLLMKENIDLASPDLMIIHQMRQGRYHNLPPELGGFPPWQIRLTEIYRSTHPRSPWRWPWKYGHSSPAMPLHEFTFRQALDEYAAAEMRLGK